MTTPDNGCCEHCNHEFKPGEQFSVFDEVVGKRIQVECVTNDTAEIVFKITESGHPKYGHQVRMRKSWVN